MLNESFCLTRDNLLDTAKGKIKCVTDDNDWAYAEYTGQCDLAARFLPLLSSLATRPYSRWY